MFDLKAKRKGEGRELVRFRDELGNLLNRFFDMDFSSTRGFFREDAWSPRVDLSESGTAGTVKEKKP